MNRIPKHRAEESWLTNRAEMVAEAVCDFLGIDVVPVNGKHKAVAR